MMANRIVKIKDICHVIKGETGITKAIPGDYPMVTLAEERKTHNEFQFDCKAVIIPLVSSTGHGHASMKRIHFQEGKFALGSILCALVPKKEKEYVPEYLYHILDLGKERIFVPLMKGMANVSLPMNRIKAVEINLPPYEEQLRLAEIYQEVSKNIDLLKNETIKQKDYIPKLRQSILQMAVQGKLTARWREENPDVEPASVLLEKVKQDFEKQIQKGILKKKKSPEIIKETDHFFNIPQTYTWCRLSEICNINGGYAFKSTNYTKEGVRVIRISDFDEYGLKGKNIVRHKFINELSPYKLEMKNILMAMTGGTVGKSYYVKALDEDMYVNQRVATIKISELIDSTYIHYSLRIPLIQNIIQEKKKSTNDNISMTDINNFLISLPPLEEQKTIVSKVNQLMAWCDELEKKIEKRDAYQEKMMQAVVKQAFKTEKEPIN
ncbi:MAG: restriction endonuclease subunit S [Salinivirgaceae bacterium]|jgi:type I restriction enzyme S subunit